MSGLGPIETACGLLRACPAVKLEIKQHKHIFGRMSVSENDSAEEETNLTEPAKVAVFSDPIGGREQ